MKQLVVTFHRELAATEENWRRALEAYSNQIGVSASEAQQHRLVDGRGYGFWGFVGPDAALLFREPGK